MADADQACVVSPHLDDAILSTWHLLASAADVRVVTTFAGIPEPGFVTTLDRARGGTDSAAVMRDRRAQDRHALALAGREPLQLDLLDIDYRAFRLEGLRSAIERAPQRFIALAAAEPAARADPGELAQAIGRTLRDGDTVYVPASIGGHPDHEDVARAGLELARRGRELRLYADIPYLLRHGAPSWLGGAPNPAADSAVQDAFGRLGLEEASLDRSVVTLPDEAVQAKIAAMRSYETEFELVDADFAGALRDPAAMGREVVWSLPAR